MGPLVLSILLGLILQHQVGSSHQRKADMLIQVFEKRIGDLLEAVRMGSVEIRNTINANTLAVREWNSGVEELQATVSRVADAIARQSSIMQELRDVSKKGKGKEVADAPEESEGKGGEEGDDEDEDGAPIGDADAPNA